MFMNNLSTLCIGIYVEKREFSKGEGEIQVMGSVVDVC